MSFDIGASVLRSSYESLRMSGKEPVRVYEVW